MFKRNIAVTGLILCLAAANATPARAGASNDRPAAFVRFHLEADKEDTEKFAQPVTLLHSGRRIHVSRVPVISEQDIIGFYPFEAGDGSWGAGFYLNNHGRIRLDAFSIENRGEYVVAMVNGRQVNELLIDQRVKDGIITIPSGLMRQDIDLMAQEFPLAGSNTGEGGQ